MKIKTWIKYEESYLPSRCKKLCYRECEDYINLTLKEVDKEELKMLGIGERRIERSEVTGGFITLIVLFVIKKMNWK